MLAEETNSDGTLHLKRSAAVVERRGFGRGKAVEGGRSRRADRQGGKLARPEQGVAKDAVKEAVKGGDVKDVSVKAKDQGCSCHKDGNQKQRTDGNTETRRHQRQPGSAIHVGSTTPQVHERCSSTSCNKLLQATNQLQHPQRPAGELLVPRPRPDAAPRFASRGGEGLL